MNDHSRKRRNGYNHWQPFRYMLIGALLAGLSCPKLLQANKSVADLVDTMTLAELMKIRVTSAAFFDLTTRQTPGASGIVDVASTTDGAFKSTRDILYLKTPGVVVRQHSRHGTLTGMRGIWIDNNAKSIFMLQIRLQVQNL